MSIGTEYQPVSNSSSQYLSSSVTSLGRSKKSSRSSKSSSSSSEISKAYKHASQLYLTRRLQECYEALQEVIRPAHSTSDNGHHDRDDRNHNHTHNRTHSQNEDFPRPPLAPVATATTSQRIKIWSLYVALLNAVVELGDEEGKQDFGAKLYRELVKSVQSGNVWEQVVRDGYTGRESGVDAEVVYNLSNLLLANAPNQLTNQSRLETWLSLTSYANLDFSTVFQDGSGSASIPRAGGGGTDTPKDLTSRIKILELFVLHVLPQNDEWDYAQSFVNNSEILDEERREAFMQRILELRETKEQEEAEATQAVDGLDGFDDMAEAETETDADADADQDADTITETEPPTRIHMNDDIPLSNDDRESHSETSPPPPPPPGHQRTSSETDYGIEEHGTGKKGKSSSPSSSLSPTPAPATPSTIPHSPLSQSQSQSQSQSRKHLPPSSSTPSSLRKPVDSSSTGRKKSVGNSSSTSSGGVGTNNNLVRKVRQILLLVSNLTSNIASAIVPRNSAAVFRTVMFFAVIVFVFGKKEVRDRLRRILDMSWAKVRGTVGMGVKVSYI